MVEIERLCFVLSILTSAFRLSGGGFGGCTVALVKATEVENVCKAVTQTFAAEFGFACDVLCSDAGEGARIVYDRREHAASSSC